jgi:integration host factor subunit alpha
MTKADIFEKVQKVIGLSKNESAEMVEAVFAIMKSTLESGENLKISGFGSFIVKQKKDRRGRNPQTGETIIIEARRILTFKPSDLLKDQINKEISP